MKATGSPPRFWSRLTASLAARWPAMGSDAALILERPSWDDPQLVDALARDLADLPAAAAVVIDDAQFAEASQRTLARLARHLPAHVRLLVASQHNPVFSTSRLRLAGVITELRADDLAFTQVEVEQLLELAGLGREPVDGRRLCSLTEGWPAGLQMAMLAMRAGGDPREVIDAFAATTRETSDYLASEVMNRLPPDLAGFLTSICVLEEFDAGLCQALSGRDDAGRLLDRVVADDLFISQVDRAGQRFRLHQMFAAFLRARLKSLGGTQFRDAHLRAAAALRERGDRLGALRHAMAVADMQLAAAVLADSMHTILDVTHAQEARAAARAWLARFGDAAAEADPGQLLQFVFLLAAAGHREAEGWLTKVNRAHPSPAPGLDALAHGVWAAYHFNRGSVGLALEHNRLARQAVSAAAGQGPLFPMLAELPLQEAGAHLLAGDLAAAAAALQHGTAPLSAPIVEEFRITRRYGLGGIPARRPGLGRRGAGPGRRGCRGTPRRGARGRDRSSPTWPQRGSTWSGASTSPPRPCWPRRGRRPGSTAARSCRPWSTPGSPGWPPPRGTGRARWRRWPRRGWPWPRPTTGSGPSSRSRSSASRSPWRPPKRAR